MLMPVPTSLEFDDRASRRVEAMYLTPDVVEQRRVVIRLLEPRSGDDVLDVGAGPGLLAGEIATLVGESGRVCGIDNSDSMLALASARLSQAATGPYELRSGNAEDVPYEDGTFDAVVSTQVLEYVADTSAVLSEIHRVLKPAGRLLVLDTDWDSIVWHSSDRTRMERILRVWEQHLADPHLPRTLGAALRRAGFDVASPVVIPMLNDGYDPFTYSAGLIDVVASFVTGRGGLTDDQVDVWRTDLRGLGEDYFFSLNRYAFLAIKSA
jgi:ubiquinone/menaquinone biosynthesis C-methylase UbiE